MSTCKQSARGQTYNSINCFNYTIALVKCMFIMINWKVNSEIKYSFVTRFWYINNNSSWTRNLLLTVIRQSISTSSTYSCWHHTSGSTSLNTRSGVFIYFNFMYRCCKGVLNALIICDSVANTVDAQQLKMKF